jgi:outer membrane protein TolC
MKKCFIIGLLLFTNYLFAQQSDTISIQTCYELARTNYPLSKQIDLNNRNNQLRLKNLSKNYLPQMNINAQASYQSDVTEMIVNIPNINMPTMDKDMYKATLDINQVIFDGNSTLYQKYVEKASLQTDQQSLEVELNKIKDRINQIYFNIILMQQNENLLNNVLSELNSRLKKVEASVKNETALQSNADVIKAEIFNTEQKIIEASENKKSAMKMLELYISKPVSESSVFILPDFTVNPLSFENTRPEMTLYDLQKNKFDASKKLSNSKLIPKLSAFGQAGVGKPGYNMLLNEFKPFYMIGAKLTWNFWNWNQTSNEKKIFDIQKNIVDAQKETFDKNIRIAAQKDISDIQKFQSLIAKDNEIINLRKNIVKSFSSQLENGVITSTEYVTELNNETQAKLNLELHKVQLQMAKVNYLNNLGKL